MKENEISGFLVESIALTHVEFVRAENIAKNSVTKPIINLSLENKVTKTIARCKQTVYVDVINEKDGESLANIEVTVLGVFKKRSKDSELNIEQFAALNAHAIIYPFVREHISNLSLKAGIGVVMLPSVNFAAFFENRKQQASIND